MIIYKITNKKNGKVYIGQTVQKLADRWKVHRYDMRRADPHCKILTNACKKYGIDSFEIEELAKVESLKELNTLEIELIEKYNSLTPNGYNIRKGGNGGGKHSEETRKKLSKANLGNTNGRGGKGIKRHSEEWKQELSRRMKGKPKTKESLEKRSAKRRKPIIGFCKKTNQSWFFNSAKESEKFGFNKKQISKILNKEKHRHTHGGFEWIFYKDFKGD